MLPPGYTAVHNSRLPWTVLFNLFCFVLCVCFVPCIFCVFFVYFCVFPCDMYMLICSIKYRLY